MSSDKSNNSIAKTALDVWQSGVPLDRAVEVFGNAPGLAKIRRAARRNVRTTTAIGKANFRKAGKDVDAFLDALAPFEATMAAYARTRPVQERHLFERLRSGELVAFGFPVHVTGAIEPETVPVFLFDRAYAKWGKRSFVGHGRQYIDVTILEFERHAVVSPLPKKSGRPSFADDLETIAQTLTQRSVTISGPPWKSISHAFREVGGELALPGFTEDKPSNETIRRFITDRNAPKP